MEAPPCSLPFGLAHEILSTDTLEVNYRCQPSRVNTKTGTEWRFN